MGEIKKDESDEKADASAAHGPRLTAHHSCVSLFSGSKELSRQRKKKTRKSLKPLKATIEHGAIKLVFPSCRLLADRWLQVKVKVSSLKGRLRR